MTLSRYNKINSDLGQMFVATGKSLPDEQRTSESLITQCMDTPLTKAALTEIALYEISQRWKLSRYLQKLYLDDVVSKEYDLFRARFVKNMSKLERAAIVQPNLVQLPRTSHPLQRNTASDRLRSPSSTVRPDFQERFHQGLCLQSMAIASRKLAQLSVNERSTDPQHPNDLADETVDRVAHLWSKDYVVIGGETIYLKKETKLECIEVFDFLYLFLLRKALPFDSLDSWTELDPDDWPYHRPSPNLDKEEKILCWYSFLDHARWTIQPHDLADLIKHLAETLYPTDKHMYMRERGIFDLGTYHDMDWFTFFERSSMVVSLLRDGDGPLDNAGLVLIPSEYPCWWDHTRLRTGSPFSSEFPMAHLVDPANVDKLRENEWTDSNHGKEISG